MLLLDKFSGKPVYEQLIEGVERNILTGIFATGTQLPSLRELSAALSVNPNTIQKSYAELTRHGVICPSPGSGCYVSHDAKEKLKERARNRISELESLAAELYAAGLDEHELTEAVKAACNKPKEGGTDQ